MSEEYFIRVQQLKKIPSPRINGRPSEQILAETSYSCDDQTDMVQLADDIDRFVEASEEIEGFVKPI